MAAIIDIRTGNGLAAEHSHEGFSGYGSSRQKSAPSLRVIHGGKSDVVRLRRRVFFIRRALVMLLLVVVVLAIGMLLRSAGSALASSSGRAESASAASVSAASASAASAGSADTVTSYFVRSGDSLWSLAVSLAPQSDPRDVVEQIVALNADSAGFSAESPLRIGQSLRLPAGSSS